MNPPKIKIEYDAALLPQTVETLERIRLLARERILRNRKRQAGPPAPPNPERVDRGCKPD